MKVIIIGAGIGGLMCAIACRRENLDVVVLERAPALAPIGAGIQIPPNAARVARQLGVLPDLKAKSIILESIEYVRYANGKLLFKIDGDDEVIKSFGETWMVIARPDYHEVLWNTAKEAGADLRLNCEMEAINFEDSSIHLVGGEKLNADVIVGADGLWSRARNLLIGRDSQPVETGDLAYRGTIRLEDLQRLNDPGVSKLIKKRTATCWMGPGRHCVFYPLKGGQEFNLVLLRPDDLPKDVRQAPGDLNEMKGSFDGWESRQPGHLSQVLEIYESLRKARTTLNVQGATSNQHAYHVPDGPEQEERDAWLLSSRRGPVPSGFTFADSGYMRAMLAFDPVADSIRTFKAWEDEQPEIVAGKL
ncbi:hypothetical protein NW762_006110 [Fusarium torreyae]|uniref:FAD-binding domain-containing protein n=1 Tax=Fusarium torreyae TaxID=1237075 RepID=A0A9W8RZT7_9HYPO|nr:hypothetical protein NW762_006110 [Fusarium torreyae]